MSLCCPFVILSACTKESETDNIGEYKAIKIVELQIYSENLLKKNIYRQEDLTTFESYRAEGKERIENADSRSTVDGALSETKTKINAIEKQAMEWEILLLNSAEKKVNTSFLNDNRTYGVKYSNENYDPNDPNSKQVLTDEISPQSRSHIVTNREELEEIFVESPQVDFEKEMFVVIVFSTYNNLSITLNKTLIHDDKLQVKIKRTNYKTNDTTPETIQLMVTIKTAKLNIDEVKLEIIQA